MRSRNEPEATMATLTHRIDLQLGGDEVLPLADIRGRRLCCIDGTVWITLDRDLRDIFLRPGESFVVDRDGVTLLHALAPARVRLDAGGTVAALAVTRGWRRALARAARRLLPGRSPESLVGA
jgi:hypothetical protein